MMFKLAYRNLSRRKTRTLIAISAVLIAVSLFTALNIANNAIMYSSYKAFTEYLGDFDVLVYKSKGSPFFNATNVSQELSLIDEVSSFSIRLVFGSLLSANNKTLRAAVIGINLTQDSRIGRFDMISGELALGDNRCLVLKSVSDFLGISVGDKIVVYYLSIKGVQNATLTVSGIVNQYGKLPIDMKSAIFVDISDTQRLLSLNDSANIVFIKLDQELIDPLNPDKSVDNIVRMCEKIQEVLGFDYTVNPIKASILLLVSENLSAQKTVLYTFSSVTILMAIILIVLSTTMNINERIREIGILRAMGATKTSIFLSILLEAMFIGLIASLLGLIIGSVIAYCLFKIFVREPNLVYQFVITPTTVLEAIIMGTAITGFGSLYPGIKASRMTPAEVLQPAARRVKYLEEILRRISPEALNREYISIGVGISLTAFLFTGLLPTLSILDNPGITFLALFVVLMIMLIGIILIFAGAFSKFAKSVGALFIPLRKILADVARGNILRYKQRYVILYVMLALSVSALLIVGIIVETQIKTIELSMKIQVGAEIVIYGQEPLPQNITSLLRNINGIADICPVTTSLNTKVGDLIFWKRANSRLYGIAPENYTRVAFIKDFGLDPSVFTKLEENNSVIISKGLADLLSVSVGDTIRIELLQRTFVLRVVGVLSKAPGFVFTKFKNKATTGTDILVSINAYEHITNSDPNFSRILIKVSPGYDPSKITQDIQEKIGSEYDIQTISIKDYMERVRTSLEQLERVLFTLLLFAVIVSVLGEGLSVIASINERVWELGVLRAIGASRIDVSLMFSFEIFLVSLLSFVTGVLSAIIVSEEIIWTNNLLSEISVPLIIPQDMIISTLLITVVFPLVLAAVLAYKYSGRNIAEILAKAEKI
ncbi:MAG: FtsX-like permease family protein [Candidatus Njordarchaeales archaeon]